VIPVYNIGICNMLIVSAFIVNVYG
jgi:hypothetical protein